MSPLIVALLLLAAALHATWNAILRSDGDRLWAISVMGAISAAAALPFALIFPAPAFASWPYIAASAALQVGYCLTLVRAYREGQLAHVYPIARGSAPLLVAIGAAVFAADRLGPMSWLGVSLVAAGILTLAMGKDRPDLRSTLAALGVGGFIASYMVVDGIGVRVADSALGYAVWQGVAQGVAMVITYTAIRRTPPSMPKGPGGLKVAAAAVISAFGYGVVIWAMSRAPMGEVSALRETSILFAALIGVVFLHEPLTARRVLGAVVIAVGAICLSL